MVHTLRTLLRSLTATLVASSVYLSNVVAVHALTGITNPAIDELGNDPAAAQDGSTFINYFIVIWRGVIAVGALIVVIYFLWGALEWIYSGGDTGKVQKARDKMTQAVIGLILLVGSFVIISFISMVFFGDNFDILRLQIPGN